MDTNGVFINIHSIIPSSGVNGPGNRMVVFFQGCSHACPDCFNPDTHPFKDARFYLPEEIFKKHLQKDIEGITISGGEPFHQPAGLLCLLKTAKEAYGLATVVYTGFEYEELEAITQCRVCIEYIDVLIDGRFEKSKKEPTLLARGSTNQRFYFFTDRYKKDDFYMPAKAEIIIGRDGAITETGFSRVALLK